MKLPMFKFFIFRELHSEDSVVCAERKLVATCTVKAVWIAPVRFFASPFMNAARFPCFLSLLFYHIAKIYFFFE